jgi:hypothetical protein
VLHALLTFAAAAAEHEKASKTAFYIAGGALAGWGFLVGILGTVRHGDFPDERSSRAMMGITALLVLATMAAAIATG